LLQFDQANSIFGTIKLFAVIVLYKVRPSESVALNTFNAAMSSLAQSQVNVKLLLYDNTPGGQDPGELPSGVLYTSDIRNGGLAKAYNHALKLAHEEGFDWLLTLDQDTSLPTDFLSKLIRTAASVLPSPSVGAIAPVATSDGRIVSPKVILRAGTLGKSFPDGFIGPSLKRAHAINSASTIRVSALEAIGGYDPRFNLWFSDILMYNRLYRYNYCLFVAGDIHVKHEMSGFDLKTRSTPQRYRDILQTEEAFYDEEMDGVGKLIVLLKLIYRLVYGLHHTGGSLPHFKLALKFLCRRIFYSRRHRMRNWEQVVRQREAM